MRGRDILDMLNVIAREMVAINRSFFLINLKLSHLVYPKKNGRKCFTTTLAKKKESSENSRSQERPLFPLRAPKNLLSQAAVAVFGLGFIDAGYSGDWTRIGVISKESEDLLKVAAFVVVPLCVFLIFSISKEEQA